MIVRPACDFDYVLVCRHLRSVNAEESHALRGSYDHAAQAREFNALAATIGHFRIAYAADHGPAIALLAAYRAADGAAAIHLIATEAWPAIGRAAFRHMRRAVVPLWFPRYGIRQAVTDVRDTGFGARKWLRALGFADCGPPRALGRDGEMFQRVVWSAPQGAVDAAPHGLVSALPPERSLHV